ncbi:DUF6479 family protein [Yinghuangia soli]|uniref:DUF6479 family protein n=1 Tax=Yinghuangia soli TaxID=2908204 RepID=A0AA41TZ99_9ACTN|nr:DUF6479 family protein [Yinghuangia soli]MCF2527281.1 DUF6479 family protein [Yinghuangia soli]
MTSLAFADLAAPSAGTVALAILAVAVIAGLLILPVVHGVRHRRRPPPEAPPFRAHSWDTPDHRNASEASPQLEPDEGTGADARTDSGSGSGADTWTAAGPHPEEREPSELPHDGSRMTPHEFPGFGNMSSRIRRRPRKP